jgi:putative Holliday junction resolvase
MRVGVRLALDVGKVRIGVARCDAHAVLATPVETVPRDMSGASDIARILELIREHSPLEIVVGLPLGLSGQHTASTIDAEGFAQALVHALSTELDASSAPIVRLVDERLSTVSAQTQLRQSGRNTKQSRSVIDQAAAVVILNHALDTERSRGEAPGTVVLSTLTAPDPHFHASSGSE